MLNLSASPIVIRVIGKPKPQPRPRGEQRPGFIHIYTPSTANLWKKRITQAARPLVPAAPFAVPIRVDVDFLFKRPGKLRTKRSPAGRVRHTRRPDRDNLDKVILDCLVTLGFLADDKFVCEGEPRKFYAAKDEQPGAIITITPLEEPPAEQAALFAEGAAR